MTCLAGGGVSTLIRPGLAWQVPLGSQAQPASAVRWRNLPFIPADVSIVADLWAACNLSRQKCEKHDKNDRAERPSPFRQVSCASSLITVRDYAAPNRVRFDRMRPFSACSRSLPDAGSRP